jgi:hypothetical protein
VVRGLYYAYGRWQERSRKEYQWDANNIDPQVTENGAGRVAAAIEDGVTYLYSYTPSGLIKTKQMRMAAWNDWAAWPQLTARWTYDNEGRVTTIRYPSGVLYTYGYDAMGRARRLEEQWEGDEPGVVVSGTQYNAGGQLTRIERGWSPSLETFEYNVAGQLTRDTVGTGWPGQSPVIDVEYRYAGGQNNGRITQMKDWKSGEEDQL